VIEEMTTLDLELTTESEPKVVISTRVGPNLALEQDRSQAGAGFNILEFEDQGGKPKPLDYEYEVLTSLLGQ